MINSSSKKSTRHWKFKEKARHLRAQGFSYAEIIKHVPVAKSSISLWCRDVPLTTQQRQNLLNTRSNSMLGIEAIQTMFWQKRCAAFSSGLSLANTLTKQSRFTAGLMLYWAEGSKTNSAAIANSDSRMITYMVNWFEEFFSIPPQALTAHLHLHSGQNEQNMKQYWSGVTRIPIENFRKSFIKPEGSGYRKNILYQGTIKIRVKGEGSTYLIFQILGAIAGIISQLDKKIPKPEDWMTKLPHAK